MVAETKLSRPRLPNRLIEEEARIQLLDRAADVPFTLLSAPAGFGKTTLVTQWLDDRKPAHAWLTIDARDDTPHLFWRSVSAALARVDSGLGLRESTLLAALEPGAVADPVALLVNRISDYARTWQASQRLFLILDDFHLIRGAELLEQFRRFIDFAPGLLRVICISRTDPPIRIAQLLAREQILRLGTDDLCFDLELTRRFVHLRREDASTGDITRLYERTRGWPAALQLSALSMTTTGSDGIRGQFPGEGSSDALAAFLLEEVFGQLSATLQQFLLDISLLPLFSEEVANRARGRDDARQLIAAIGEHNLPLQRFGSGVCWYRLHDLLVEWLRPRVEEGSHTRKIRLAAAQAFDELGQVNETLDLLLAEQCYREAEALIPQLLQADDLAGHAGLAERFPASFRKNSPALTLLEAVFCFLEGQFADTLHLAERADALLEGQASPQRDALKFVALLLRCPSARFTGNPGIAHASIRQLSEQLGSSNSGLHNWGLFTLGMDALMNSELKTANDILAWALAGALVTGDSNCALRCLSALVPVLLHQGQVNEAVRCFERTCRKLSQLSPGRDQEAMLAYLDGLLALERNQLQRARASLEEASRLGPGRMNLMDQFYLAFENFRLGMLTGNEAVWRAGIDDLAELHQRMGGGAWFYNIVEPPVLEALARLRQGDPSALIEWTANAENHLASASDNRFLRLQKHLLVTVGQLITGQPVDERLDELVAEGERGNNHFLLCHARVMQVLLLAYRDKDWGQATGLLAELLQLTVPAGVLRPFLDADPMLVPILEQCVKQNQAADPAGELLAMLKPEQVPETIGHKPANGHDDVTVSSPSSSPRPLPEPLSQRERHVLRLLSEGLSNKLMSRQLGITVATVKSHLSNIYGKLDADNRGRAVARARSLGLLE